LVVQSSYLVDFALSSMHMLFGEDAGGEEDETPMTNGALSMSSSAMPRRGATVRVDDTEPARKVEPLVSSSSEDEGNEEEDEAVNGGVGQGGKDDSSDEEEEEEEKKENMVKARGNGKDQGKVQAKQGQAKPSLKQSPGSKGKAEAAVTEKTEGGRKGQKRRASMDDGQEEGRQSRKVKAITNKVESRNQSPEPQKKKQRRRSL
jgi:hypothetical protein